MHGDLLGIFGLILLHACDRMHSHLIFLIFVLFPKIVGP